LKPETRNAKLNEVELLRRIILSINSNLDLKIVLKEIVEMVVALTRADACLIYLLNESSGALVLQASKNPHPRLIGHVQMEMGEGITGWVAQERQSVAISQNAHNDPRFKLFHKLPEDHYHAFLSVPITKRGKKNEIVGVINLQHKAPHAHTKREIALLTTIGQLVGSAIENARLYEEMKKKALQVATLSRVSHAITSNRYLEEILHLIVTMTAEMMNSKICSIMILDADKGELRIAATQSLSEAYRNKPSTKVGESVAGRVVKTQKPIAVLNVATDATYAFREIARREGLVSLLSVPMMVKNRIIGVINSYTAETHHYSQEEIHLLSAVAHQAAVAIENTRLLQQSSEMQEALMTRKAVERAKGILIREEGIGEEEAFRVIQKQSMDARKSMREVAEAILLASKVKKTVSPEKMK